MLKSSPHQNLEDYALKRLAESPLRVSSIHQKWPIISSKEEAESLARIKHNNYKEVIDNDPKPITDPQSSK